MESTLDFEDISKKLEALVASQQEKRGRNSIALLDKVQPALLKAWEQKVPIKTLAVFLKENGIAVGITTLRLYLNAHSGVKKVRRRPKKKSITNQNNVSAEASPPTVQQSVEKKLPPRLAERRNIT